MENPRYGWQLQQAMGVDSLVRDSFDPWPAAVISEFGVLELSSCSLTFSSFMWK
jgi:hypothetical protein